MNKLRPLLRPRLTHSIRYSSQSTTPLQEWLFQIPDHPNTLSLRKEIRPEHLKRIDPFIADRQIVFGGAFLHRQPSDDEFPQMAGSFILVRAASKDEAMQVLKDDPYTKGGVWDLDGVKCWPFKSAFRTPVE